MWDMTAFRESAKCTAARVPVSALRRERSGSRVFCYHRSMQNHPVFHFFVFWGVNTLSLWVAEDLFDGISFATVQSLLIAGLVLGIVNAVLKPLLLILTLPLSVLTLGIFVLVVN